MENNVVDRKLEYKMCRKKNKYNSREAYRIKNKIVDNFGLNLRVYKCPLCFNFHLGHRSK